MAPSLRFTLVCLSLLAACAPPTGDKGGGDGTTDTTGGTTVDPDNDGDGSPASEDCDDTDADVSPLRTEVCDGKDNDCDGAIDDDDTSLDVSTGSTFYADSDGDGFGNPASTIAACGVPSEYVGNSGDCDDTDSAVHPDATEICDAASVDEDCNDQANDADPAVDPASQTTFYADFDGDGYGDPESAVAACEAPSNHVTVAGDCDDTRDDVNPDGVEVCDPDNADEDCSGAADDDDPGVDPSTQSTYYTDADGDTHGDSTLPAQRCDPGPGYADVPDDCDDGNAAVNPGATDTWYDGVNSDCDGANDYDAD